MKLELRFNEQESYSCTELEFSETGSSFNMNPDAAYIVGAIPGGGLEGQVLTKASDAPRDVEWRDVSGDKTDVYYQNTASSSWNVTHNLGKYPSVSVTDSAGNAVFGEVKYVDENNLIITFSAAFSGNAYMN